MTSINTQGSGNPANTLGADQTSNSNFRSADGTFIDNEANIAELTQEDRQVVINDLIANSLDFGIDVEETNKLLDAII